MNTIEMASTVCMAAGDEASAYGKLPAFPVERLRKDFPIFNQQIHGHPLVYLDSAASAQKPHMVMRAMQQFMERDYANINRGVHELSVRATDKYEAVRGKVQTFLNAEHDDEIIFTHVGTEGFNLVAHSWGRAFLKAGDEIVLTTLEHHANIVPWQMLRDDLGIVLRIVPITEDGDIDLDDVKAALSPRTKLVTVAHVSNALGTILPIRDIITLAHNAGALALIDGCQAVMHMPVDVQALDADFYIFTGHKLYGPTGIGILYGKRAVLRTMKPYQGGGDMIASVSFAETTYKDPPHRFEAGTPPIVEAIGLGAAIDYVTSIGLDRIKIHEGDVLAYATERLRAINSLKIIGNAKNKACLVSFTMEGAHPHDIGTVLDQQGIAIRAGHHCAQPLMESLGIVATARASFALYNSKSDVDALVNALQNVQEIFA
jgi:cysteine desulfurase/selenocysteine lyase